MPTRRRLILLGLAACCLLLPSAAAADGPVDFRRDIWPLLSGRCVTCHGPNKVKGGLRLDSRQAAAAGGHLGQNLLREPAATNDLVRRIKTTDLAERMPLEGQPLSADEIALVTRWIEQGAPWPDETSGSVAKHYAQPPQPWLDRWLPFVQTTMPAWYFGLIIMLALLLIERSRLRVAQSERAGSSGSAATWLTRQLGRVPRLAAFVGLLLAVVWGLSLLLLRERQALRALETQLANERQSHAKANAVEPPSPLAAKHPPRLGGEYYRGNDERSPMLFNGGYYRTATMNVQLVGSDSQPCSWLDPYPAEPRIALTIERAPQATPYLFTESIMAKAFLSPVQPVDLPRTAEVDYRLLQTIVAGEKWLADYALPACSTWDRLRGQLFLYSERGMDEGKMTGLPHYRIDYDLWVQGGNIEPQSRLSMVSLFQPGNVAPAPANRILPDEWFDFRPIPVIEGEQTTDPELLGIPEHQDSPR